MIRNVSLVIVMLGALNYGFFSIFEINIIGSLAFGSEIVKKILYFLIGLAGIRVLYEKIAK